MSEIADRLVAWQKHAGRHHLPWQQNPTAYRVWVSEIMLQQTQVATVIDYYLRFMQRFTTVKDLAQAEQEEVMQYWAGLGYYSRARNLHKTAKIIYEHYDSLFPSSVDALEALPGIGRSTAGAILSFSQKKFAVICDGNVKRVLTRHFEIPGWPGKAQVHKQLWHIAESQTHQKKSHIYNQAIMDLGATICTRSKPNCHVCPLKSTCQAFKNHRTQEFPHKKPKTGQPFPQRSAYLIVLINKNNEVLLVQKPDYGIWGGLWSLPEADIGTNPVTTLEQQQQILATPIKTLEVIAHKFSHYQFNITPIIMRTDSTPSRLEQSTTQWVKLSNHNNYGVPSPVRKLFQQLVASRELATL